MFPPIFFLALAYILGVILNDFLKIPFFIPLALILFSLVFLLFSLRRSFQFSSAFGGVNFSFFLILLLLLGIFLSALAQTSLEKSLLLKLAARQGKEVKVEGRVVSEPRLKQDQITFAFKVNSLRVGKHSSELKEFTKVIIKKAARIKVEPGERLSLKGILSIPKGQGDPEFNYQKYLYYRRIQTLLEVNPYELEKLSPPNLLISLANSSRQKLKAGASRFLKGDKAGLFLGVLIGDTSRISEDLQENFRKTGLTHILAVSGMNVGMLILAAFFILKFLKVKPLFQLFFIAALAIFYTLITQYQPSILRASIMSLVGLLAWISGRKKDFLAALSAAALTLLIYDPFLIFNVSFQLSFAATLAILLFFPVLQAKFERLPRRLKDLVAVSLAAQLGVVPFLIYYFNQISLISLLANVLVVPVTAPILTLGLAASFLNWLPFLNFAIFWLLSLLLSYIIKTVKFLSNLPGAAILINKPHFLSIFGYYFFLGGGVLVLKKSKLKFRGASLIIFLLLLMISGVFWQVSESRPPSELKVTFFDVGQGDSTLIQTPEGKNILVDGGESPQVLKKKLERMGLRKFDLVILSHPHLDHVGGLVEAVKNYTAGLVLDSGQAHTSLRYREFLETIKERGIPYKVGRQGQEFRVGKNLKISVLSPRSPLISGSDSDLNNNSLVIKVNYGGFSLLLPGDAQKEAEERLLAEGESLEATVLKVPHQGSRDASSFPFLKKVKPQIALILVGKDNPYGHPHKSTLTKLKALGVKIYRTDENGDIRVTSNGKSFKVSTEK